ncbi:MAG: choice-of-anchor F family protein, partial [Psychromonas sp.]
MIPHKLGYALAKYWPVGEPSGIKIVNDDFDVNKRKASNCIMSTSYLDDHYLDSEMPIQVICSSPYQSHKRYKLAMLPSTVDGTGSESVDLVFNVEEESDSRDYQVFQKINNWTDSRLQGFTIQVGFGVGTEFETLAEHGVDMADLNISVPNDIWDARQLAMFSAGLFGPVDKHTGETGFFDKDTRAGFFIDQYIDPDSTVDPDDLPDLVHTVLYATTTLGSNYANLFGPWLPNTMLPWGIFFDDDNNPTTDADLLAWYDGSNWLRGVASNFSPFSDDEIIEMSNNLAYTTAVIDDLVNVGLNYNVSVGDISLFPDYNADKQSATFTIRITPTRSADNSEPDFVGVAPSPALIFTNSDAEVELQPLEVFYEGELLTARIGDADLNTDPAVAESVIVRISTDSGLSDDLTLIEQGLNRGVFAAVLPDQYLDVIAGTTVTLTYSDISEAEEKTSSSTAEAAGVLAFEATAYTVMEDDG